MALVELRLSPLPSHVRTARLVVVAAARRAGLDPERVDELRLALGEACSRAVGLHAQHAPGAPVLITVSDDPGRLTVTVTDQGPAAGPAVEDVAGGMLDSGEANGEANGVTSANASSTAHLVDPDIALAVVSSLVDDVDVDAGSQGTVVTMRWPLPARAGLPSTAAAAG